MLSEAPRFVSGMERVKTFDLLYDYADIYVQHFHLAEFPGFCLFSLLL